MNMHIHTYAHTSTHASIYTHAHTHTHLQSLKLIASKTQWPSSSIDQILQESSGSLVSMEVEYSRLLSFGTQKSECLPWMHHVTGRMNTKASMVSFLQHQIKADLELSPGPQGSELSDTRATQSPSAVSHRSSTLPSVPSLS